MKGQKPLTIFPRPPREQQKPFRIRKNNMIPGVIYGRGRESILFQIPLNKWDKFSKNKEKFFKVQLSEETYFVGLRGISKEPDTGAILHLDLQLMDNLKNVTFDIPIILTGEAKGGLNQISKTIKIEGKPWDIPNSLNVDITDLNQGEHLNIGDIRLPSNIKLLSDINQVLVSCLRPRLEKEPEEEKIIPITEKLEKEEGEAATKKEVEKKAS